MSFPVQANGEMVIATVTTINLVLTTGTSGHILGIRWDLTGGMPASSNFHVKLMDNALTGAYYSNHVTNLTGALFINQSVNLANFFAEADSGIEFLNGLTMQISLDVAGGPLGLNFNVQWRQTV